MKQFFPILFFLFSFSFAQAQLDSFHLAQTYTVTDLQTAADDFGVPPGILQLRYEIDAYKVYYTTPNTANVPTLATGMLCVPRNTACSLPLVSYHHGTAARKTNVPSYFSSELNIGLLFGSTGYIVSMPDYLGLGDSPGLHPYVHADSEASASLDMLRASQELCAQLGLNVTDELFLFGYSQGGHSTVAVQKAIQEDFPLEFTVTASAPMSGPYDISGAQAEVISSDNPYPTPGYLPYVMLSYQLVYGNLYNSIEDVLIAPYAQTIPPLFDGTNSIGYINGQCTSIPKDMYDPAEFQIYLNDPNHPFKLAQRDNDLYDWAPMAPTKILYCMGDDQVTYMNSVNAFNTMTANGAPNVESVDFGDYDHGGCVQFCLLSGKSYFDSFRLPPNGIEISFTSSEETAMGAMDGMISASVTGGVGAISYLWSTGDTGSSISNLAAGEYSVTISDAGGCDIIETVSLGVLTSLHSVEKNTLTCYPNPANDFTMIELPSNEIYTLRIYDIQGALVKEEANISGTNYVLELGDFSNGLYLLELNGKEIYRSKLVKQ